MRNAIKEFTLKMTEQYINGHFIKITSKFDSIELICGDIYYGSDNLTEQYKVELSKEDALELSEQLKRLAERI
jgi:hypothetical protein